MRFSFAVESEKGLRFCRREGGLSQGPGHLHPPLAQASGPSQAHLLPLQHATPGQQFVAEPVLIHCKSPKREPR